MAERKELERDASDRNIAKSIEELNIHAANLVLRDGTGWVHSRFRGWVAYRGPRVQKVPVEESRAVGEKMREAY